MELTRRGFLTGLGVTAGTAAAGAGAWAALVRDSVESSLGSSLLLPVGSSTTVPPTTTAAATTATTVPAVPYADRILVVLELAGGNDALNTLAPLAEGRYHDARPTLAHGDDAVAVTPELALHPALAPLLPAWDDGRLVAVAGVGMPEQSRSHFTALDTWWSGTPGTVSRTGWLGRWLDASLAVERNGIDDPLRAIALGGGARALAGATTTATVVTNPDTFRLRTLPGTDAAALIDAFLSSAAPLSADPTLAAAQLAIPATVDAIELLASASGSQDPLAAVASGRPAGAGATVGSLLGAVAGIIELGIGTRVFTVGVSGFDTHADQADRHQELLADVAEGIVTFLAELDRLGMRDRVMLMTTSEFGRRVGENGSGGTDHGRGGVQFVAGPGVTPRTVHGGYDLGGLVDGDLPVVVDARSVYVSALEWLAGPGATDAVFTDGPAPLVL